MTVMGRWMDAAWDLPDPLGLALFPFFVFVAILNGTLVESEVKLWKVDRHGVKITINDQPERSHGSNVIS